MVNNFKKLLAYDFPEVTFNFQGGQLSFGIKANFYQQMYILLKSGLEIHQAIDIFGSENTSKKAQYLVQIKQSILAGKSLSESMRTSGKFSSYEIQSIAIGEETGQLNMIFQRLSLFFQKKRKLRQQFIGIMIYPMVIFSLTVGVVYFMLVSVVPMFEDVFRQFNQDLPTLTLLIIKLSNNIGNILLLLILILALFTGFILMVRSEERYRLKLGQFMLKIPVYGQLIRLTHLSTFMETLGLLIAAKVPLVQSLSHLEATLTFFPLKVVATTAKKDVTTGLNLVDSFKKFPIFGTRIISQIQIAEEVNQIDEMLGIISKQLEEEIEHKTKLIGKLIEPLIIIVIGSIVGFIMVAMYLPLFNLSQIMI